MPVIEKNLDINPFERGATLPIGPNVEAAWYIHFSQWHPVASQLAVNSRRWVISRLSLPALTHL